MADTIKEKICANIKTTLEYITIAHGYVNTIASVQRWQQQGNSLTNLPCIIIAVGPEDNEDRPGFITSCKMSIALDVYVYAPTNSDTALNSILGDIKKVLMTDYTRGGYAVTTRIQNIIPFEAADGQPNVGLIISVEIEYRHKTSDPTT